MTPEKYLVDVLRTAKMETWTTKDATTLATMGLAGEVGEVVDLIKKELFHGKPRDRELLVKEMGDVLWYYTLALHVFGFTYKEVAEANVMKLRARYPDGFSVEAAQARMDEVSVPPEEPLKDRG